MSAIPSSAMPHAYAHEGEDLRDPHGGKIEESESPKLPGGYLLAGAAAAAFLLYRALR
jgi:hypothetical protein